MKTQVVQLGLVGLIQIGVLSDNELVCSLKVLEYKIWVKLLGSRGIQAHADEKVKFVAKIHLNFNFKLSSFSQPFV